MVSTHQQYLCPDFLSPLPATTAVGSAADDSPGASCNASSSSPLLLGQSQDSGKSPLALLAQTCNSIGLPDLPSNTNKSDGASQCTNGGGGGGESRPSPSSTDHHHHHHHGRKEVQKVRSSAGDSVDGACSSSPAKCKSSTSKSTTPVLSRSPAAAAAAKKEKHSTTPTQSLALPTLPTSAMFQHLLPPAPPTVSLSLTNGGAGAFALPPNSVVQFPCFGGVSSTTALVPPPRPCADPFCKTCPPAARACPIGCAQCAGHASQDYASSVWMNPYLASPFFNAGLHPSVAAAAAAAAQVGMFANLANALAGSNHHPTVAQFLNPQNSTTTGQQLQLQQQQQSYVCNWMTGDQYCGKRFASGDELLQHLRSHATHDALKTAPSNSSPTIVASSSSSSSSASSVSASASALLTRTLCQQQNAAASYLSSLRFHPYTKILSSAAAAAALPVASPLAPFAYGTPTIPPTIAGLCPSQRLPGTLQQP
ncbi:Zinc finger protein Noc [Trichinella pseudospiralis]|uniref:Zinc finger protein Noc n=1 Tax=Trichinella pseudospiralis TaxID=6337 RepID=A0A0V1FEC0_TRIPS|nr:Zinc finger protein Noc [Trichinella pseudospiralis]